MGFFVKASIEEGDCLLATVTEGAESECDVFNALANDAFECEPIWTGADVVVGPNIGVGLSPFTPYSLWHSVHRQSAVQAMPA